MALVFQVQGGVVSLVLKVAGQGVVVGVVLVERCVSSTRLEQPRSVDQGLKLKKSTCMDKQGARIRMHMARDVDQVAERVARVLERLQHLQYGVVPVLVPVEALHDAEVLRPDHVQQQRHQFAKAGRSESLEFDSCPREHLCQFLNNSKCEFA